MCKFEERCIMQRWRSRLSIIPDSKLGPEGLPWLLVIKYFFTGTHDSLTVCLANALFIGHFSHIYEILYRQTHTTLQDFWQMVDFGVPRRFQNVYPPYGPPATISQAIRITTKCNWKQLTWDLSCISYDKDKDKDVYLLASQGLGRLRAKARAELLTVVASSDLA